MTHERDFIAKRIIDNEVNLLRDNNIWYWIDLAQGLGPKGESTTYKRQATEVIQVMSEVLHEESI